MAGSGYRNAPALVRRSDGQTLQLTRLLYQVLDSGRRRARLRRDRRRRERAFGRRSPRRRPDAGRVQAASARRVRAADGSEPEARKANPLLALRFRWVVSDPAVTRRITDPVRLAVPAGGRGRGPRGVRAGLQVGALRPRPGSRGPPGLRPSRPAAGGVRDHACCRPASTSSDTPPRPATAAPARCDGRRAVPGLAGVLHRRHRQLPARPGRPDPHRPRRPVLQRAAVGGDVRGVGADRLGCGAAGDRHPADPDGAAVAAAAALRRLPPAGRHHRRAGPVPPDQAHPARACCPGAGAVPSRGCSGRGRGRW